MELLKIIVGAVIGYLLPHIVAIIAFLLIKKKEVKIIGNWHIYFWWIVDGGVLMEKMKGEIKKTNPITGILKGSRISKRKMYTVNISDEDEKYSFKGYAYIERSDLCFEMFCDDIGMQGYTYNRYSLAQIKTKGICCGMWLSSGFKDRVSVGSIILTRDEKNKDELNKIIKDNYKIYRDIPFIELK